MREIILGSGGVVGNELAKVLAHSKNEVRLVSRNPRPVVGKEELFKADLTNREETIDAVTGADIVYLTVGLLYDTKVWKTQWPLVMQNVIEACNTHGAKLIFLDNVYAYGKVDGWMKEETPYNPCSKKGEVRAKVAAVLETAMRSGEVNTLIARSADFYGRGAEKTFAKPMIFDKYKAGKSAAWLLDKHQPHSMTYTKDIAKALAFLAHDDHAYGQVWHLPTDKAAPTGEDFMNAVAKSYGVEPKQSVLSSWMLNVAGLFDPLVRETKEMAYQFDAPYLFDSSKFEKRYFQATPYDAAIEETVALGSTE